VFDAVELVKLFTGKRNSGDDVDLDLEEGEIEQYGVHATVLLVQSASKMKHVKTFGLNFDSIEWGKYYDIAYSRYLNLRRMNFVIFRILLSIKVRI